MYRKIVYVIAITLVMIFLFNCSLNKKSVKLIIANSLFEVQVKKGTVLTDDIVFSSTGLNNMTLYYDKNFTQKYENERIKEDLILYLDYCESELLTQIREDFRIFEKKYDYTVSDVWIEFYMGKFNNYIICMYILRGQGFLQSITKEKFGDLELVYPDSNKYYCWKDGDFYTLTELYNSNEISIKDIETIIERDIIAYRIRQVVKP